jgi:hypothetical protein
MKKCPSCGHIHNEEVAQCQQCGRPFSKILELISAEAEEEELATFRGQCKRILQSGNIKEELLTEYRQFKEGLSRQGWFTLYVIIAFVFFLTLSVL